MKKIGIFLVILLASAAVYAQQWSISTADDGAITLSGPGGKTATVASVVPFDQTIAAKVGKALETAWALPGLSGTRASAAVETASRFRIVLFPDRFMINGKDYLSYLPAGVAFYYDTVLFYDITLKVDNLLPKVYGAYVSPDDVLQQIQTAVVLPERYMYDAYLLDRIERLERGLMAVSKKSLFSSKPSPVDPEVVSVILGMYNADPSITKDAVTAEFKNRGMKVSSADINAVFMVYLGIIE
jgi:hypothetical protein